MFSKTSKFLNFLMITFILLFVTFGLASAQDSPYRDIIDAAGCSDKYDGADIVDIFDSTNVEVEESGLSHIKIITVSEGGSSINFKSASAAVKFISSI